MLDAAYKARLARSSSAPSSPPSNKVQQSQYQQQPLQANSDHSSDRFIPRRSSAASCDSFRVDNVVPALSSPRRSLENGRDESASQTYLLLLQSELGIGTSSTSSSAQSPSHGRSSQLHYSRRAEQLVGDAAPELGAADLLLPPPSPTVARHSDTSHLASCFSLNALCDASQRLLASPKRAIRIPKVPFKVLEAPQLADDFYLNLVDWSSQQVVAVALADRVFLWNAVTSNVEKLAQWPCAITSLSWMMRGTHLAVGDDSGCVSLWDVSKAKCVRTWTEHQGRAASLAWNSNILSSGGRDRLIYQRDVRDSMSFAARLAGHRQEVCGLRWSEHGQLASGGNDNKLMVWALNSSMPLARFEEHTAAVKAIAWSPHQRGLLASGGGTADRCLRFWNTISNSCLNVIDTGSQVCNLAWSKNANELVSTHGYSLNEIVVWSYPSMQALATLTGHSMRVLYLAISPDGETLVTGAGDETLKFWSLFPHARSSKTAGPSSGSSSLTAVLH